MTVLATAYMNGCNYQVGYDLISQSVANNTSTVRVYGVLNVTNNYISWSSGAARVYNTTNTLSTYYSKGSYTLAQETITVTHNNDGTKSFYCGGSMTTTFVSSGEIGGTIYLPRINRYPQITSAPNFTDADNPTMYFTTNTISGATYNACISLTGARDDVPYRQISVSSGNYTFNLTSADRKALIGTTKPGQSKNVTFFLRTDANGTSYYSTLTKTFTVTKRPVRLRINGEWKEGYPYVRVNGEWKEAKPYIRVNNDWKEEI